MTAVYVDRALHLVNHGNSMLRSLDRGGRDLMLTSKWTMPVAMEFEMLPTLRQNECAKEIFRP